MKPWMPAASAVDSIIGLAGMVREMQTHFARFVPL